MEKETWFKIFGFFTIVGAIAALLVVPEVRKFLGFESQASPTVSNTAIQSNPVTNDTPQPREEIIALVIDSRKSIWTVAILQVQKGDIIRVDSSGIIDHGGFKCGPDGNPDIVPSGNATMHTARYGALIGRIGAGEPFVVGSHFQGVAPRSGDLSLLINDGLGEYGDNSGSYRIQVAVVRNH